MPGKQVADEYTRQQKMTAFMQGNNDQPWLSITDTVEMPDRWKLYVSIKPTKENLQKALEALMEMPKFPTSTLPGVSDKRPPAMRIFVPFDSKQQPHYWDPTFDTPVDGLVSPEDPRGGEVVIEVNDILFTAEEYKKLMLQVWAALEKAEVELSYITPAISKKEVIAEKGIVTPFSYAFPGENADNESLLANVIISLEDLDKYKIQNYLALVICHRRMREQRQHLQIVYEKLWGEIKQGSESTDLQVLCQRLHSVQNIDALEQELSYQGKCLPLLDMSNLQEISQHPFIQRLLAERKTQRSASPVTIFRRRSSSAQESDIDWNKIAQELSAFPYKPYAEYMQHAEIRKIVESWTYQDSPQKVFSILIRKMAEIQMQALQNDFMRLYKEFPHLQDLQDIFFQQIAKYPRFMQSMYRRLVHCLRESLTVQIEMDHHFVQRRNYPDSYEALWQEQDNDYARVRHILNDYIKGGSIAKVRLHGHFRRHHFEAVKAILCDENIKDLKTLLQQILNIPTIDYDSSLAKRIHFICSKIAYEDLEEIIKAASELLLKNTLNKLNLVPDLDSAAGVAPGS